MALEGWPPDAGAARSARILSEIDRGNFAHTWCPLRLFDAQGNLLEVLVSCDALKIDGVRVNADAQTEQRIADRLGALLLTPKLADAIWQLTAPNNRLDPKPQPISSSTAAMINHSLRVDFEVAQRGAIGPVADPGKDWVVVRALFSDSARAARKAANYSWHVPEKTYLGLTAESAVTPGLFVIQGVGTVHDISHVDYSQVVRLAKREARYNEAPVDLADVYTGKGPGNALVSHEGPLPGFRQPGVPEEQVPPPPVPVPAGVAAIGPAPSPSGIGGAIIGGAIGGAAGYALAGTGWGVGGAILGLIAGSILSSRRA